MTRCKSNRCQWSNWKTLYYPETYIGYAAIRACKVCRYREFNDWTTTRIGNEFKVLPPEPVTPPDPSGTTGG